MNNGRVRRLTRPAIGPAAAVVAVVAIAAWRQSQGFTRFPLFFDDAWAALPSRFGVITALKMSVSTPGWTELLRLWIRMGTNASWWAQLPSLLAAIAMGLGAYALCRRIGFARWPSVVGVTMLVTNPTTLEYATRVKPYTVEMVLAVALLWSAEVVRRRRDWRSLAILAVVSVVAFAISFSVFAVLVGVWVAVLLWFRDAVHLRFRWLIAASAAAIGVLAVGLPYYLTSSARLGDNWQRRGYLEVYSSLHKLLHNSTLIFSGFLHNWSDLPIGHTRVDGTLTGLTYVDAGLGLFVVVAMVWWTASPRAWRERPELVPVGVTMLIAVLLALGDVLPFGDGRTDEVLYPGLTLVVVAVVQSMVRRLGPRVSKEPNSTSAHRVVVAGLLALAVVLGSANLAGNHALYPEADLKGLFHQIEQHWRPGDVIVVPAYLSFSWAEANITPWKLQLKPKGDWPQGFRAVSKDPMVILPQAYEGADPQLRDLQRKYKRIWYIGYELGVWDPYAVSAKYAANDPLPTYTNSQLVQEGWRPFFSLKAKNCYAEPYTWPGTSRTSATPN
jgi:chromate transport protein ChrA